MSACPKLCAACRASVCFTLHSDRRFGQCVSHLHLHLSSCTLRVTLLSSQIPVRLQMEGMVNDLHVGREKQQQFDEWKQGQPDQLSIDLSVTVLTTGFWPSYKVCC